MWSWQSPSLMGSSWCKMTESLPDMRHLLGHSTPYIQCSPIFCSAFVAALLNCSCLLLQFNTLATGMNITACLQGLKGVCVRVGVLQARVWWLLWFICWSVVALQTKPALLVLSATWLLTPL